MIRRCGRRVGDWEEWTGKWGWVTGEVGAFPLDLGTTALCPMTGALNPEKVQSHMEATTTGVGV